jgi:isopentenyl phosphate kinase
MHGQGTVMSGAGLYEVIVIKVGGSLITDKTRQGSVREEDIDRIAAVIGRNLAAISAQVIIILGGGSVGHFAAKQLAVDQGVPHCELAGLHRMAGAMYALKNRFAESLAKRDIAALALQETSYIVARADGGITLHDMALRHVLALRMVPIASGGLVFDEARGVRPLNGDLIPLALDPAVFKIRRVVMLTDVPGVVGSDGAVIRTLDEASASRMARLDPAPGSIDVTGGMDVKVKAALALARRGIPTVICSGKMLDDRGFLDAVDGEPSAGTLAGFNSVVEQSRSGAVGTKQVKATYAYPRPKQGADNDSPSYRWSRSR